jgi:methyl-accepting chemotaxis protein
MNLKSRLLFGIRGRLFVLVGLVAMGCAALAAALILLQSERAFELRKQHLRELVATAHGVLALHKEFADSGQMTVAEARARALKVIGAMWYGKNDYFTARDTAGVSLLNPSSPEKVGTNRNDNVDSKGRHYSQELTELVQGPGEGFVTYNTRNPDTKLDAERTTYIKLYKPWDIAVAAGVFTDDVKAEMHVAMVQAALITLVLVGVLGCIAIWQAGVIARALTRLRAAMLDLAAGRDISGALDSHRRDEIGDIARAVEAFKIKAIENARLEADQKRAEQARMAELRKAEMHQLADVFQVAVGDIIDTISSSAIELEGSAGALTKTAQATQHVSATVTSASIQTSNNVQSVAAATEELAAASSEIGRQVCESREIADAAAKQAEKIDARIAELAQSAVRIGDVITLITSVAAQTHLLALNATIEAARAGAAGRTFAVVAQEVRELAAQTAKATGEISAQIAGMQAATSESVKTIKEICGTISRMSEIAATIATAILQQDSSTEEIANNVQQVADGAEVVATNIAEANRSAAETGAASSQVLASANSLSRQSGRLKTEVDQFLKMVRAA